MIAWTVAYKQLCHGNIGEIHVVEPMSGVAKVIVVTALQATQIIDIWIHGFYV